ncbi:hypothetical protein CEXT_734721 [Caerostris extrusa]|uniref:Uncharacterized protein n=1 Tax=Caerostris extrusa TaxID=172846 RepID=A0AAV4N3V7_CAEEX|nr:hypothetical protein CEXT_734721 [Caerostris extrusa]
MNSVGACTNKNLLRLSPIRYLDLQRSILSAAFGLGSPWRHFWLHCHEGEKNASNLCLSTYVSLVEQVGGANQGPSLLFTLDPPDPGIITRTKPLPHAAIFPFTGCRGSRVGMV